jgi:hypothetical protein
MVKSSNGSGETRRGRPEGLGVHQRGESGAGAGAHTDEEEARVAGEQRIQHLRDGHEPCQDSGLNIGMNHKVQTMRTIHARRVADLREHIRRRLIGGHRQTRCTGSGGPNQGQRAPRFGFMCGLW